VQPLILPYSAQEFVPGGRPHGAVSDDVLRPGTAYAG